MSDNTITVLVVEPMKRPYAKTIPDTLEAKQELVSGHIEVLYPFDDPVAVVCNEEGKLQNLPPNRLLRDENGIPYDFICGTFFVAGVGDEDFKSLSPELVEKYDALYRKEALIPLPKQKENNDHER